VFSRDGGDEARSPPSVKATTISSATWRSARDDDISFPAGNLSEKLAAQFFQLVVAGVRSTENREVRRGGDEDEAAEGWLQRAAIRTTCVEGTRGQRSTRPVKVDREFDERDGAGAFVVEAAHPTPACDRLSAHRRTSPHGSLFTPNDAPRLSQTGALGHPDRQPQAARTPQQRATLGCASVSGRSSRSSRSRALPGGRSSNDRPSSEACL